MRVLLLGGSGFVGSHLADRLVTSGHEVSIFHPREASLKNIAHLERQVRIIEGDFYQADDLVLALKGMEVVVHLVNSTIPGNSLATPVYDIQTNVIGTINLLDICIKSGLEKLVLLSSGGTVYGIPEYTPLDERHPLNPIAPYGISKLMIEKYLAMYHYHYGLDYTVLRLSNIYGNRQDPHRGQGVLAAWMHCIAKDEPVEIWGDGSVVRDYIYVDDAVRAIELACLNATAEKIFNVGSGVGHSLSELSHILERTIGAPFQINYKTAQKVDVPINVLDVSRIRKILNWQPVVPIEQGIDRMWKALNGA